VRGVGRRCGCVAWVCAAGWSRIHTSLAGISMPELWNLWGVCEIENMQDGEALVHTLSPHACRGPRPELCDCMQARSLTLQSLHMHDAAHEGVLRHSPRLQSPPRVQPRASASTASVAVYRARKIGLILRGTSVHSWAFSFGGCLWAAVWLLPPSLPCACLCLAARGRGLCHFPANVSLLSSIIRLIPVYP
jgi:hypothetical protein